MACKYKVGENWLSEDEFKAYLLDNEDVVNLPPVGSVGSPNQTTPPEKESKFNKTVQGSTEGISKEAKESFDKSGAKYIPKTVKETATSAQNAWDSINSNFTKEAAISEGENLVNDLSWNVTPEERGVLAGIIAKELNVLRNQPGLSIEQIQDYDDRAVELFKQVRQILTQAGQTASILGNFMKGYFLSYPEQIIEFANTSIDDINSKTVGRPSQDFIFSAKEIIDDLLKTKEGRAALDEYANKKQNINQKYKQRKQAVEKFYDRFINDVDNLKGISFSTPIPPGIIQSGLKALKFATIKSLDAARAVELALAKIKEGMGDIPFDEEKAKAWLKGVYEKANAQAETDLSNSTVEDPVESVRQKLNAEYEAKVERARNALKNYNEALKNEENKQELQKSLREKRETEYERDQYLEAINNLKGDKLSKFVYKIAFEKMNGKSRFSDSEILRAYQQVNGGVALTPREQAIVAKNAQIISDVWKSNEDFKSGKITQDQWFQLQYKAAQASTRIKEIISPRGWYDMISSAMAAGFLSPKTLLSNIAANLLHKSYTAVWEDTVFSFLDILYSPGDKRSIQERFNSLKSTAATKEYFKAVPGAIKQTINQIKQGTPSTGSIEKYGNVYQPRPIEAWLRMTDDWSKDTSFMNKVNDTFKNAYEGTVGFVHAGILRALSGGDTLFRQPEQAKFNKKIADELGVPLDIFLTDDVYSGYREVAEKLAERLTFQNKTPLSIWLDKKTTLKNERSNKIAKWFSLIVGKPIVPYLNTPINVKYEMLSTIPIFAIPEFLITRKNALDTKLSLEERFYNRKISQKTFRKMVGSLPLWLGVSYLLASKLVQFVDVDEEDDEEKNQKKRKNLLYFQGAPIKIKINLPGTEGKSYDAMKLGPLFDYMYIVDQTNKAYEESEGSLTNTLSVFIGKNIKGTFEQTFFAGLNNLLEALNDRTERNVRNVFINSYGAAFANLFLPATLNYVTQLADDEKVMRLTKDESFKKELFNKTIRERLGFLEIPGIAIEELPPIYNVAGEPIKTDIEGRPDWVHYLFDFTKEQISDPDKRPNVFIFKKYEETKDADWLYPLPPRQFKFNYYNPETEERTSVDVKLTPALKNEYQRILGQQSTIELQNLWSNKEFWQEGQTEPSLEQVTKAYERAKKSAQKIFYQEFKDQLVK